MKISRNKHVYIEHHPFYECCLDAIAHVNNYEKELAALDENKSSPKHIELIENEIEKNILKAVIFAAITAENFINLYAESAIDGDSFYTPEALDSLSIESKWVVIPFIATGQEIDKNCNEMKELRDLIKVRNQIIHAKPHRTYNVSVSKAEKNDTKFENKKSDRARLAKRSHIIINNIFKKLTEIDDSEELQELLEELNIKTSR